jgi:beta-lactamase regulating signal transducer with metallopeptidase domain
MKSCHQPTTNQKSLSNFSVNIRPLGLVFLTLLSLWIYKTRFANVKLQIPDNLTQTVQSATASLTNLRQNKPGTYLLLVSGALVLCACIGHIISGKWVVLAGFIVAVLVSTKYQIKIIRENVEGE